MTDPTIRHPDCLCGHSTAAHRTKVFNNRVYPFCVLCAGCNGFGIIRPAIPRALLLEGEDVSDAS